MSARWLEGVGLHTGLEVRARFLEAPSGSGVIVRRTDVGLEIPARPEHVSPGLRCTRLVTGGACVETVEHALAALVGLGVRDAILEVDGPEVPILDGSALPFVALARDAGLHPAPPGWSVAAAWSFEAGDGSISFEPGDGVEVSSVIEFEHPAVGRRDFAWSGDPVEFEREIAPARSFGFTTEIDLLRAAGRIRGGSLASAVVFGDAGVLNPEGLRFADEPARHKLLDLLGDLCLVGGAPLGRIRAFRYGHRLGAAAFARIRDRGR
ncbi:MAG: UDP-3-O-[3-hydroxymyristoyl] N-acetylglucosamine deacetylase [Deltaproteobacteria bacterium]|nr:UDP-3-O-[3-hydroxymyristoyl] N-acetylglucosamine deacetylase [Deltaproteobacteria bacterium]